MGFKVYCKYEDYIFQLNFYIFRDDPDGRSFLCTSIDKMEFIEYKQGEHISEPTFCLRGPVTKPFLQAMADELKEIGVTAKGEPVIANELTAVKYHLEDMRRISFMKLKIEEPIVKEAQNGL